MNKSLKTLLMVLAGLVSITSARAFTQDEPSHTAVRPAPREGGWTKRHEKLNDEVRRRRDEIKLLFIGDSITDAWSGPGTEQWNKRFAPRGAVNLGIGGDRTQHVLWRLENGNIEGLHPKAAVLMIGTNNSNGNDNTAEEIADGIKAIVAKLRKELPEMKILLLAIFPRGEKPNPQREKNAKASKLASEVADGKMVHYLDIGDKFLNEDGTLSKEIMPDYLHLTPKGYAIWAEAIEPKVAELMGEATSAGTR
jgi:lysophospholipase L1-like esterase